MNGASVGTACSRVSIYVTMTKNGMRVFVGAARTRLPHRRPPLFKGGPLPCHVLGADHAAQAGAGSCEVFFESGDPIMQGGVLVGGVLQLVGELVVVAGQFVDTGGQVGGAEGVELLAELVL